MADFHLSLVFQYWKKSSRKLEIMYLQGGNKKEN